MSRGDGTWNPLDRTKVAAGTRVQFEGRRTSGIHYLSIENVNSVFRKQKESMVNDHDDLFKADVLDRQRVNHSWMNGIAKSSASLTSCPCLKLE